MVFRRSGHKDSMNNANIAFCLIYIIQISSLQQPDILIRRRPANVAQPRKAGCGGRQPLRCRPTTTRRGGACSRPFCRTQVFVGGRFVNRPYGGPLVSAVGAGALDGPTPRLSTPSVTALA